MPLASTKFAPGFDKQSTSYGAEGKWVDGENIRFRYSQPEKIGGWVKLFGDKLIGVVRDQFAWSDLTGTRHLALSTDRKLYVYKEGVIIDITPIRATQDNLTNPFVTTSGSAIVTVTDAAHGAVAGDFVTFSNSDAVGGLDMNAEFEITDVSQESMLGGRQQSYFYELFGNADNLPVGQKSAVYTKTFNESRGRNIRLQMQSEVTALTDNFSGQRNGWGSPTIDVVQDNDTTNNWKVGEHFTHLVDIENNKATNPFWNGYDETGFRYKVSSIGKVETPSITTAEEKFLSSSQLSDISLYRSLVQKSNQNEPEHKIVYINETQENETVPTYGDMTLAGLSLRASRNFTQLDQLRCWISRGLQVKRLHDKRTATYGNGREIGPSNLFADLVFHLLTDQVSGAGALLGMKTNDAALLDENQMVEAARFMKTQKLYFNGPVTDRVNIRQFITDLAPNFLCNFIVADGKLNDLEFNVPVQFSSWVAVRILPSAHTNPVFVVVDEKPIRASRRSAEWCLAGVNQCWKNKERFIAKNEMQEALSAYDHARQTYQKLIKECRDDRSKVVFLAP